MQLNDFDYSLPEELIAQAPAERRDGARLMCLNRRTGLVETTDFVRIARYFEPGDVLVLNDTKVIPARLLGHKKTGGKIEILLVRRLPDPAGEDWLCLTKSSHPLKAGVLVELDGGLVAEILEESQAPYRRVRFCCDGNFLELVDRVGHLPLPPYIRRADSDEDRDRYQTVFAREQGAVAAPTAGLHFTAEILAELKNIGVEIAPVTLHVGLGTFLPVRVDNIREHKMHSEQYSIPESTAALVNRAKQEKRRVFALGTTSARALETATTEDGQLQTGRGESEIFIYPGYRFKSIDALVTNFHLPKSTLLMLISAFAGREQVLSAYRQAVAQRFRFFSYGDCMLIL